MHGQDDTTDPTDHLPTVEPLRPPTASQVDGAAASDPAAAAAKAGATTPVWAAPSATPVAPVATAPVAPWAATPANRAGEPSTPASATSSRPVRNRWLAGVLAISVASATIASAATVGVLAGTTGLGATTPGAPSAGAGASANPSGSTTTPVSITASDAVVAVAQSASPAVVTITTESAGDPQSFGPGSFPSTGIGSGFIFDSNGLILTNHHVIEGGQTLTVTFQDGSETPATLVSDDPTHDLAVVKVAKTGLPTLEIGDSKALKVGQLVVAIGSPLGTFTETVTSGILSATNRTIEVGSETSRRTTSMTGLLQTDAAINEGNSGGPLLDATGQVVGVNVAVAASAQGIGFAIPIDVAATIMAQARAGTA
jgi:putative serine protease PepD